jgi:predicted NUDIX family NTP pyrophosphohydrolase
VRRALAGAATFRPSVGTMRPVVLRQSAGILLFRRVSVSGTPEIEVLLAHPGGPFFARRDEGHWSIPKGEPDGDETDLVAVARREFAEEVGSTAPETDPDGAPLIALGTIVQKGGKVVHAWAIEGDLEAATAVSNTFEMEWPPRSGQRQVFPEIDRVAWFSPADARLRLKPTQIPFVDRLVEALAPTGSAAPSGESTAISVAKPDGG